MLGGQRTTVGMGAGYFTTLRRGTSNTYIELRHKNDMTTVVDSHEFTGIASTYYVNGVHNGYGDYYVVVATAAIPTADTFTIYRVERSAGTVVVTSIGTITLPDAGEPQMLYITADGSQFGVFSDITTKFLGVYSTVDASVVYDIDLNAVVTGGWSLDNHVAGLLSGNRFVVCNVDATVMGIELYRGTDNTLLDTLTDELLAGGRFENGYPDGWVPSGDGLAYVYTIWPVGNTRVRLEVDVLLATSNVLSWNNYEPHRVATKWKWRNPVFQRLYRIAPTNGRIGLLGRDANEASIVGPNIAFYVIDPFTGAVTRSVRNSLLNSPSIRDIAFVTDTKAVVVDNG